MIKPKTKGKCARCGSTDNLTKDHIIPKALLKMLCVQMLNEQDNLQVLCQSCNTLKAHTLDPKHPKTMRLLRKYVDRYESLYVQPVIARRKYVFRTVTVTSLSPQVTHLFACDRRCQLELIYKKQKKMI